MVECFCNSKDQPRSCCGENNEVYSASFCGQEINATGSSTFEATNLVQNWITGAYASQRSTSALQIAMSDSWKQSCSRRLGEGVAAESGGDSCSISETYQKFSGSNSEAFIQSVTSLLPAWRQVAGEVITDDEDEPTHMEIAVAVAPNAAKCSATADDVCKVQVNVKGGWAKQPEEEEEPAQVEMLGEDGPNAAKKDEIKEKLDGPPLDSSALTCVDVVPMSTTDCSCVEQSTWFGAQLALRNAVASARSRFVVDANVAFQQVLVARSVVAADPTVATQVIVTNPEAAKAAFEKQAESTGSFGPAQLDAMALGTLKPAVGLASSASEPTQQDYANSAGITLKMGLKMLSANGIKAFNRFATALCGAVYPQAAETKPARPEYPYPEWIIPLQSKVNILTGAADKYSGSLSSDTAKTRFGSMLTELFSLDPKMENYMMCMLQLDCTAALNSKGSELGEAQNKRRAMAQLQSNSKTRSKSTPTNAAIAFREMLSMSTTNAPEDYCEPFTQ
jgi:hypothetical protein